MIPARYKQLVFVFFMTLFMGVVLSFVFELQGLNYRIENTAAFLLGWLQRFLGTYIIVLPVVVLVNPLASGLTALMVARVPRSEGTEETIGGRRPREVRQPR